MIDRDPFSTQSPHAEIEHARRQRLVSVGSGAAAIFGVFLSIFVTFVLLPPNALPDLVAYWLCVGTIPIGLISRKIAQRGKPTFAAYLLLSYITLLLGVNSLLINGLSPVMVPAFLLMIILSGVMLPPRHGYLYAAVATIVYLSVTQLSTTIHAPVDLGEPRLSVTLSFLVVMAYIFTALLNNLLTRDLRRALDDATFDVMRMNEQVQIASDRKSQFTARTSHELRTPLSAIIVFADLALREAYGPLNKKMRTAQEHILNSARHLKRIINDLLDLSKIEAGEFEVANTAYPINEIVGVIESSCLPIAREKGLEWSIIIDKDMPQKVVGDSERVAQIAVNLVGNAVKFTDTGKITVRFDRVGEEFWRIIVIDSGPGIPEDQHDKVFEAYRSLDKRKTPSVAASTGLGLAIARNLAQLMDGGISLQSELGIGSTFEVRLPLRVPLGEEQPLSAIA